MSKTKDIDRIIHSDSNGKLYIKSPDFFNQPKIQQMVMSIMESSTFKKISKTKASR